MLLIAAAAVRFPLVGFNLPVAAHIDERTSLVILERLATEGLNPHFFNYPTLYYYLIHLLLLPVPADHLIWGGRLLNLGLGLLLGAATYVLATRLFGSRAAGLLAAALTLLSPVLIANGSYIITDILVMLFVMLALLAWGRFFRAYRPRDWGLGVLFTGLAVATKYNAILVLGIYITLEMLWAPRLAQQLKVANQTRGWLDRQLPPRFPALALLLGATIALVLALLPDSLFLNVLESGGGVNSVVQAGDLAFFGRMRTLALGAAGLACVLALLVWRSPRVAARFTPLRPYLAVALVGLIFFAGTPYALVTPREFLYDVGYELKRNAIAATPFSPSQYIGWFRQRESTLALLLAFPGIWLAWRRNRPATLLLVLYLAATGITLLLAARGYVRYLSLLLPVVYTFAGLGLVALWQMARRLPWGRALGALILGVALLWMAAEIEPPLRSQILLAGRTDTMHAAYNEILARKPEGTVYYAGYAPFYELRQAGIPVKEIALRELEASVLQDLEPGDFLILDRNAQRDWAPVESDNLEPVWVDGRGQGQYIYRLRTP